MIIPKYAYFIFIIWWSYIYLRNMCW